MRIGELSAKTGVPTPTIKYYVREGLLSGGVRVSRNQVSYGEEHVRRLRLVRALIEIGKLPIAKVREVLTTVDTPGRDLDSTLGVVSDALAMTREPAEEPAQANVQEAMAIARRNGWYRSSPQHPYVRALAEVIGALRLLGLEELIARADEYASAAQMVAATDIGLLAGQGDRDRVLESMIVGTILGDAFFAMMRRIAHTELSGMYFKESDTRQQSTVDE